MKIISFLIILYVKKFQALLDFLVILLKVIEFSIIITLLVLSNAVADDFLLVRKFNNNGINVMLRKLNENHQIDRLAFSEYWKLGIFLDLRCCEPESITSAFLQVSVDFFLDLKNVQIRKNSKNIYVFFLIKLLV